MKNSFPTFLADTLWFGMTSRISIEQLKEYATLRADQGFDAVQTVVGIPPEVGPESINAYSSHGAAWDVRGTFNDAYLDECEERVKILNNAGLMVIIYGAWGHQIDWIKVPLMKKWWDELIARFEKYHIMFCICGESNLWIGQADRLLPDKTTKENSKAYLLKRVINRFLFRQAKVLALARKTYSLFKGKKPDAVSLLQRKSDWSEVLDYVYSRTKTPLLIHPVHDENSTEAVENHQLLAAVTVQTGHTILAKNRLWQEPLKSLQKYSDKKFINLEPWYEGILNSFYTEDQLYAYWATMMSGAFAYCYGAHGVWNCGDGDFLSQWGGQTLNEGLELNTPYLIGKSHQAFMAFGALNFPFVETRFKKETLQFIIRKNGNGKSITYYPEVKFLKNSSKNERLFNPLSGIFVDQKPSTGPLVIFADKDS